MSLTAAQLVIRANAIGASETAALCGLARYATPIEIYEEHRRLIEGRASLRDVTVAMDFGVELEEPIARVYAKREGVWVRPCHSLQDGIHLHSVATPDRAVFREKRPELRRRKLKLEQVREAAYGLEVKSTNFRQRKHWGPQGSDFIPDEHLVQVMKCMGISGLKRWDVAVLIEREYRTYTVHFDAEWFEHLCEIDARFMVDHVLPGRPPPIDATDKYAEYLGRVWTSNRAHLIEADEELQTLALTYAKAQEAANRVEALKTKLSSEIKARIGDAGGVADPSFGKIYWNRGRDRTKTDYPRAVGELINLCGLVLNLLPAGDVRDQLAVQVATVIKRNTTTEPGTRPFVPFWSEPLKAELKELGDLFSRLELAAHSASQTRKVEEEPDNDDEAPTT